MSKVRKRLRSNRVHSNVEESNSKLDLIKLVIFLISFIGVVLVLLGYGYQMGIGSKFGYTATDLVNDKSDFLSSVSIPLALIFSQAQTWEFWQGLLRSTLVIYPVVLYTVLALILFVLIRYCLRTPKRKDAVLAWLEKRKKGFVETAVYEDGFFGGFLRVLVTVPMFVLFGVFAMFGVIFFITVFLVAVPALGIAEGKKVADDYIINAKQCASKYMYLKGATPIDQKSEKGATCVRVLQDGKEIVRGRVIARNSQRIFLYVREYRTNEKKEKEEIRVPKSYPVRNAIIERVDTEDITEGK